MTVSTLIGTPDPDHIAAMPSPLTCSCIFTASTAGPFGVSMRIDAMVDPTCPRHRRSEPPRRKALLQRTARTFVAALSLSTRPKYA